MRFYKICYIEFMMKSQSQRRVLVTGAAGALGQKVCEEFLKKGDAVIGTFLDAQSLPPHLMSKNQIEWLSVNLSHPHELHQKLKNLNIDVLVHCAGGFRFSMVDQLSDQDFDFLIDSNLKSSFYLVRELLPQMKEKNYGRLVFISSKSTFHPPAGMAAYCASKAAINALVLSLAEEVKKFNIQVNAFLPTVIDTPANRMDMPQSDFSSWVNPSELAEMIYEMTTERRKSIHGALIPVAGRV